MFTILSEPGIGIGVCVCVCTDTVKVSQIENIAIFLTPVEMNTAQSGMISNRKRLTIFIYRNTWKRDWNL